MSISVPDAYNSCRFKMSFSFTRFTTISFFHFASFIIVQSFGELVVLKHPLDRSDSPRKLTCVSEDDNAALIWNLDENDGISSDFQPGNSTGKDVVNCAIWNSTRCIIGWGLKHGWEVVNSINRPMGPVHDHRWEGLQEFKFGKLLKEAEYQYVGKMNESSDTAVFSTRGSRDIHIFLCEKKQPIEGQCIWILIGAYSNTVSAIRACAKAPGLSETTGRNVPCKDLAEREVKNVIDKSEWRTFAIKWIKDRNTIQVFNDDKHEPFMQGYLDRWHDVSHISVRSAKGTRIRFHFYEYLESRAKGANISTFYFFPKDKNFCVNMLVGLCPECELKVKLVKTEDGSIKTWNISGGESIYNGVLAWKWVKLQTLLMFGQHTANHVKLEIQTILNGDKDQGQWAIGSIHSCQPLGGRRAIEAQLRNLNGLVTCQKLSHSKSTVVDAQATTKFEHYTEDLEEFSHNPQTGKRWTLCNPTGCTCARGFTGENCDTECSLGYYGYNCDEKCGDCSGGFCDRKYGCKACNGEYLVPPFCKKKLKAPTIDKVTDNTARLLQVIEIGEVADRIDSLYFNVQGALIQITYSNQTRSGNFLTYIADVNDLKKDTMYEVFTELRMTRVHKESTTKSPKNHFETTCFGKPLFEIVPAEITMYLKKPSRAAECVSLPNGDYSGELKSKNGLNTFTSVPTPMTFYKLTRYTEYNLTLYMGNGRTQSWSTNFATLQSAPEIVNEFQVRHVSDTEAILEWEAPYPKNGIIGYTVSIQREAVLACEDRQRTTTSREIPAPEKAKIYNVTETMISVNGLHPYAKYRATIIAHTSKDGLSNSFLFVTTQKYIPTSVVHNLHFEDEKRRLKWEKPEDCTTITGDITASVVFIAGFSKWAKNSTHRFETKENSFNISTVKLLPYTEYKVQVYVIRELQQPENLTSYKEQMLKTEPAEPRAVSHLEAYDANVEEKRISLRWRPPYPPTGEIESYGVTIQQDIQKTIDVTTMCKIWEDFVCLENLPSDLSSEIKVQVQAKNKNVEGLGPLESLTFEPAALYNEAPAKPKILEESFDGRGVVSFKWEHPFSPTYITRFNISVKYLGTELNETPRTSFPTPFSYQVTKMNKTYTMKLPLAPSTRYNISMISISQRNSSTNVFKIIQVASGFGFPDGEDLVVELNETLINVKVPPIVNATRNVLARVVIEGPLQCRMFQNRTLPSENIMNLVIAEYSENINTPRNLIIDANQCNSTNLKYSISLEKTYKVQLVVVDRDTNTTYFNHTVTIGPTKNHLIFICLSTILIIPIGWFVIRKYLRRYNLARRRKKTAQIYSPATICTDNSIALRTRSTDPLIEVEDPNSIIYASSYESDSRVVLLEYFPHYAKVAATEKHLTLQFETLPKDLTKPCHYGRLPQNIEKNRDVRLLAYDDTRVVLNKLPGKPYSDYINASYIQGHRGDKAYIATQGPMPNTINDFWRMVWQEKVDVICMLTNIVENEKMKCEQYWPTDETKMKYGDVSVMVIDHQTFADYTVRIIRLSCQKYKRKITHLHYTGWPNGGIPTYPQHLVEYLKKLKETPTRNGPVVVHCDTGAGRTGTLILCDICLRQAVAEKVVDVLAATTRMRANRANMVGNAKQYTFAHVVIMESIATPSTLIPCDENLLMEIQTLKKQLPEHVEELNDRIWQDQVLYSLPTQKLPTPRNCKKIPLPILDAGMKDIKDDRFCPDVIYFERYSVLPTVNKNYIDAVSVDGLKSKKQYLASQNPSTSTWSKFWRIIAMENIELIIILQPADPQDPNEKMTGPVTVLTCTKWEKGRNGKPPIPEALVSLVKASENILRKKARTLVLCHDGVTGCGLYLALSFLLEKMSIDRECDVISAVRAVRRLRPEFVQSIEQFEYLYDSAAEYAKCFEGYSNFS